MNLDIRIDIARARSAAVGKEHGITPAELKAIEPAVNAAHRILRRERKEGAYGFWDLHKDRAVLKDVKETAAEKASLGVDNLVVMGIGGSALGITTLATALKPRHHNLMTRRARKGAPRLFVMDNIDPVSFREMLRLCPPKKTLYNVISKSGTTAETVSQLMIVLEMIEKKLGKTGIRDRVVVTTNPPSKGAPSVLESVAKTYGTKRFTIPLNVGGAVLGVFAGRPVPGGYVGHGRGRDDGRVPGHGQTLRDPLPCRQPCLSARGGAIPGRFAEGQDHVRDDAVRG